MPVTLFRGGPVLTMDPRAPVAEAIAIDGGVILAIGTLDVVRAAASRVAGAGGKIDERDVAGGCIVPGFIDSHMHPGFAIYFKAQVNLAGAASHGEVVDLMRAALPSCPPGAWLMGVDVMEDLFRDPAERFFPTRTELDRISPDVPVVVMRHDLHICAVNSAGLRATGVGRDNVTVLLGGRLGEVRVDGVGEPTGVFTENATALVLDHVSIPTREQFTTGGLAFSRELSSHGITTIGGMVQLGEEGIAGKAGAVEYPLLELLLKDGTIEQDIVFYLVTRKPKQLARIARSLAKIAPDDTRFRVGGVKAYADGSYGARTACMFEPFSDSPSGEAGFMITDPAELERVIAETHALGYQVATHAIGDKANEIVVDIYARVMAASPGKIAHRVEHASSLTPAIIETAAMHNIIFACQPAFITSEHSWLPARLGPHRLPMAYPFKTIVDAGIVLAGASDAPVESPRVLDAIQACVTRHGMVPGERIGVLDALAMFTINAARAIGLDHVKGSLAPGKHADLVVLSADPRSVPPDALGSIVVRETYHRGVLVHGGS